MRKLLLVLSALAIGNSFAAPIKITFLPFPITAPGTYVLASNLTFASSTAATNPVAAISIATNIAGPVIVDLKRFTITGPGGYAVGVGIGFLAGPTGSGSNPSDITIRNGSFQGFSVGVWAQSQATLSDITITNISFDTVLDPAGDGKGVIFSAVDSSSITGCRFHAGTVAIQDVQSNGGNSYVSDTFTSVVTSLLVNGTNAPTVLDSCRFAP